MIFVADDNTGLLAGIERALSSAGYRVRTATSGTAILELLERASQIPDLLLLDVMMPGMNGLEVTKAVSSDPRWMDIPVVLITAANDEFLAASALRDGAVDFLPKPFRLGELLARIDAHVQRARELSRARAESRSRPRAAEVVRNLDGLPASGEMLQVMTGRLAALWAGSHCSIVVCDGADHAKLIASSDGENDGGRDVELKRYPEIRAALAAGDPLLVEDTHTSPLFRELRSEWEEKDLSFPFTSVVVIPLAGVDGTGGALLLRSSSGQPPLNQEALATLVQVRDGLLRSLGQARIFELLHNVRLEQPPRSDSSAARSPEPSD